MNRALIYVLIPGALVAVTHATLRWGARVALPLGIALTAVVMLAYWRIARQRPGA